jgi:hypothetical protein
MAIEITNAPRNLKIVAKTARSNKPATRAPARLVKPTRPQDREWVRVGHDKTECQIRHRKNKTLEATQHHDGFIGTLAAPRDGMTITTSLKRNCLSRVG